MRPRLKVDPLLAVALAATVTVIALYAVAVSMAVDRASQRIPVPSTFSSSPEGLKVLYRYLDESGVDVRRLEQFDALPEEGTIVIVGDAPLQVELTEDHAKELAGWVRQGGRLVLAGNAGADVVARLGISAAPARGTAAVLRPRVAVPLTQGVDSVAVEPPRLVTSDPRWVRILYDDAGDALIAARVESGTVVWLADRTPLTNAGIGDQDNGALALQLLAADPPVWFDEFHQGFARGGSAFDRLGPEGQASTMVIALAVALTLLSVSRRYGPPVPVVSEPEARTLSYIDSLAALYRRSAARREALATLRDGLSRALARRYGSPAAGLKRHPMAAEALRRADELVARGTMTEKELHEAARLVAAARREVER